jgi:hypothetical protein
MKHWVTPTLLQTKTLPVHDTILVISDFNSVALSYEYSDIGCGMYLGSVPDYRVETSCRFHPASYQVYLGALPREKWTGRKADN